MSRANTTATTKGKATKPATADATEPKTATKAATTTEPAPKEAAKESKAPVTLEQLLEAMNDGFKKTNEGFKKTTESLEMAANRIDNLEARVSKLEGKPTEESTTDETGESSESSVPSAQTQALPAPAKKSDDRRIVPAYYYWNFKTRSYGSKLDLWAAKQLDPEYEKRYVWLYPDGGYELLTQEEVEKFCR